VTRDGATIPQAAWGVAVPVDPGDHQVAASAPGHEKWSTVTNVNGEKTRASVAVPMLKAVATPPPAPTAPLPAAPPPSKGGLWSGPGALQREAGLITGGLGVVGLGVGAVFGTEMLSNKQTPSSSGSSYCSTPGCGARSQSAVSDGNVATAGFAGGGALLVLGVALFLSAPTSPKTTAATIVPMNLPRGGGLGVAGVF
jgi:serine/threonine-protein kinase